MNIEAAIDPRERVRVLDHKCAELRARITSLQNNELRKSRARLADAISAYAGQSRISDAQNRRDFIASEVAERARLAKYGPAAVDYGQPARSVIDQHAAGRGDSNTFLRKQMKSGYRRSGLPSAMRGYRIPSQR
jgi:hypothetical protein